MLENILAPKQSPEHSKPLSDCTLAGMPVPALLQTARLCAQLGVNSSTIWRWIRDPERNFPKPIEVGSKVRMWRTVDVENWLNSQTTAAQAARQSVTGAGHEFEGDTRLNSQATAAQAARQSVTGAGHE